MSNNMLTKEDLRKEVRRRYESERNEAKVIRNETGDDSKLTEIDNAINEEVDALVQCRDDENTPQSWKRAGAKEFYDACIKHYYNLDSEGYDSFLKDKDKPTRKISASEIAIGHFKKGEDPRRNPNFQKFIRSNDFTEGQGLNMIAEYFKEQSHAEQDLMPYLQQAQRDLYKALANGDKSEAQKIYNDVMKTPGYSPETYNAFTAFANEAGKELVSDSKLFEVGKVVARGGAEFFAPSAYDAHMKDLETGGDTGIKDGDKDIWYKIKEGINDVTSYVPRKAAKGIDYIRGDSAASDWVEDKVDEYNPGAMAVDAAVNAASVGLDKVTKVPRWLYKMVRRGSKGISSLGRRFAEKAAPTVASAGLEAGRQVANNEDFKPGDVIGAGTGEAAGSLLANKASNMAGGLDAATSRGVKGEITSAPSDPVLSWNMSAEKYIKDLESIINNPNDQNNINLSLLETRFGIKGRYARDELKGIRKAQEKELARLEKQGDRETSIDYDADNGTLIIDHDYTPETREEIEQTRANLSETKKALRSNKTSAINKAKRMKQEYEEALNESPEEILHKRASGKKLTEAEERKLDATDSTIKPSLNAEDAKKAANKEEVLKGTANYLKHNVGRKTGSGIADRLFTDETFETQADREARWLDTLKKGGSISPIEQQSDEYKQFKLKFPRQDEGVYVEQTYAQ